MIKDTDTSLKDIVNCKDRHLKIQRDRLVDEFTAALTAFQAVQRKTVELEKNAMRQAKAANASIPKPPGSNKSTSNSYPESSGPFENNFIDNKIQSQMQMQEEVDLQALEEQERTIRELEDNIVGVNEIYKKLGALVYEQGNTIDSIEASVENSSVFVQEGADQLRRASHYSVSQVILFVVWILLESSWILLESSKKEKNHSGSRARCNLGCHSHDDFLAVGL